MYRRRHFADSPVRKATIADCVFGLQREGVGLVGPPHSPGRPSLHSGGDLPEPGCELPRRPAADRRDTEFGFDQDHYADATAQEYFMHPVVLWWLSHQE